MATVAELVERLQELGVEVPSDANKPDLEQLLEEAEAKAAVEAESDASSEDEGREPDASADDEPEPEQGNEEISSESDGEEADAQDENEQALEPGTVLTPLLRGGQLIEPGQPVPEDLAADEEELERLRELGVVS